jgi:hypothetical protein
MAAMRERNIETDYPHIGGHEFVLEPPIATFAGAHIRTQSSWQSLRVPATAVRLGLYPEVPPRDALKEPKHALWLTTLLMSSEDL